VALDIQPELVDEHKNLTDTAAGYYIDEGLEQLHQKYQEELNEYYEFMQTSKLTTKSLCTSLLLIQCRYRTSKA
jgi:hypothetical protein